MTKNQERKQTTKTDVEVTHTLELVEENFKIIMINMLKKLEKKMKTQMVKIFTEKESNGNSRGENLYKDFDNTLQQD